MNEVDQHWEPNLSYRTTTSEDPKTLEIVVAAEYDDGSLHDVGGIHIFHQPKPEGKVDVKIRVWGIIEYVAHALREDQKLVLVYNDNHELSVQDDLQ